MAKKNVLDIPCEFGGVSIGETTARLGVRINRSCLNIMAADEVFCGHRLTGTVVLGHSDDQPGQMKFLDTDHAVDATFDVKRISVSPDQIGTGLTFSLKDVDISSLAKFSKGAGRLVINDVAALPDDSPAHQEDPDHTPGSLKASGPWADVSLTTLFKDSVLKKLNKAGLQTVGDLANYTASERRLTDIEGIGPGVSEKIENTMLEFWRDNPGAGSQDKQPELAMG